MECVAYKKHFLVALMLVSSTAALAESRIGLLLQAIDEADAEAVEIIGGTTDVNKQVGNDRETPLMIAIDKLAQEVNHSWYSWCAAPKVAAGVGFGIGAVSFLYETSAFITDLPTIIFSGKWRMIRPYSRDIARHTVRPTIAGLISMLAMKHIQKKKRLMSQKRIDVVRALLSIQDTKLDPVNAQGQNVFDIVACTIVKAIKSNNTLLREAMLEVDALLDEAAAAKA